MEIEEEKPIFFKVLSGAAILLVMNVLYLVHKSRSVSGVTGFSIKSNIIESFYSLSTGGRIFFMIQISLIFIALIITFVRDKNIGRSKIQTIGFHIEKNSQENKTDLDVLYEALKDKKELAVSAIAKAFEIDKDTAMEWCKILESGELATVEYPGFSEPILRYNELEIKPIEIKKTDITKDSLKIKKEVEKQYPAKEFKKNEISNNKR